MKVNNFISSKEHNLLFAAALSAFLLRIVNFITSAYFTEHNPKRSFGIYDIFEMTELMSPIYSFVIFLFCIFLLWKINLATLSFSTLLTLLLTIFFDFWFIDTQQRIARAQITNPDYDFKTFDFVLLEGSFYDVLTFFIVNFLLFWQISILLRMLIKTSQKENVLP